MEWHGDNTLRYLVVVTADLVCKDEWLIPILCGKGQLGVSKLLDRAVVAAIAEFMVEDERGAAKHGTPALLLFRGARAHGARRFGDDGGAPRAPTTSPPAPTTWPPAPLRPPRRWQLGVGGGCASTPL